MSTFAVTYRYVDDPAAVDAARPDHRAYLDTLVEAGSLLISGPYVGEPAGALLVLQGESEDAVRALVDADPFVARGLVSSLTLQEWNPVKGPLREHL